MTFQTSLWRISRRTVPRLETVCCSQYSTASSHSLRSSSYLDSHPHANPISPSYEELRQDEYNRAWEELFTGITDQPRPKSKPKQDQQLKGRTRYQPLSASETDLLNNSLFDTNKTPLSVSSSFTKRREKIPRGGYPRYGKSRVADPGKAELSVATSVAIHQYIKEHKAMVANLSNAHQVWQWSEEKVFKFWKKYEESLISDKHYLTENNKGTYTTAIYSGLVLHLMTVFRDRFDSPSMCIAIFKKAMNYSAASRIAISSAPVYASYLQTIWKSYGDIVSFSQALKEMDKLGVLFNNHIHNLIMGITNKYRRDYYAAMARANDELFQGQHMLTSTATTDQQKPLEESQSQSQSQWQDLSTQNEQEYTLEQAYDQKTIEEARELGIELPLSAPNSEHSELEQLDPQFQSQSQSQSPSTSTSTSTSMPSSKESSKNLKSEFEARVDRYLFYSDAEKLALRQIDKMAARSRAAEDKKVRNYYEQSHEHTKMHDFAADKRGEKNPYSKFINQAIDLNE